MTTFGATFRLPVEFAPKDGARFHRVIVLVGAGNKYTGMPSPLLSMLGISPEWTEVFDLADGSRQEYSLAEVRLRIDHRERTTICIFEKPESKPVLGTYTLDGFGLAVDTERRRLIPARLFLG
jgi:predicted aspartyl protease